MIKYLVGICWLPSLLLAQEASHDDVLAADPKLSLAQVIQRTAERVPQNNVLQGQASLMQARFAMAESVLPDAPAISVYHQNDTIGSGRNERDMMAELELPLWLPHQRQARSDVAHAGEKSFTLSKSALVMRTAGLVRDALWEIALRQEELNAAQEAQSVQQALLHDVQRKVSHGELAKTDEMLAKQAVFEAEKQQVSARAELMHARFRYQQLTGMNAIPASFQETQSRQTDFANSPLWGAAEANVELTQQQRQLARIERRENPQVILNARNSQGAFDSAYNQSVGVRIRIPFDSPVRGANIEAESDVMAGNALAQREQLRLSLQQDLHEAEHNLETYQQQLVLDEQHAALAEQQANLAQKAFRLGELDVASVLRMQSQALSVKRKWNIEKIQYQWAIARYNQAVGDLP